MSLARRHLEVPNPLALAAIDDLEVTARISRIMAEEARAVGINWSFTPVLDINAAFRSAIVARTRGFGSDVATIERHALKQLEMFQANGIAVAIKHWPGEGFDDPRPASGDDGQSAVDGGVGEQFRPAVSRGDCRRGDERLMSGHIALPAFVREADPDAGLERYRPASISRLLNQTLLRASASGFNGLIVSGRDAGMAGLKAWSSRADYLPEVIAGGCDVILFADDAEADRGYIEAALADGRLSWARVDEAVLRQLAMKAALGLHRAAVAWPVPAFVANRAYAEAIPGRAPTLVKDIQALLPLDPWRSTGACWSFQPGSSFRSCRIRCPSQCPICCAARASRPPCMRPACRSIRRRTILSSICSARRRC